MDRDSADRDSVGLDTGWGIVGGLI
ncbi:hypothetical protein DSL72_001516 [Monilinia vaccinii-corymbosi]|uniref:Uncharacterized protein n=1 Tax=Monilinia vaccinii-corymbosi TaxID=61207 RepID=A0A8A3PAM3_9HELO|nr:hypothetical protein DSL72_001516 [Monilinia vaccinii-corymbosi]